MEVITVKNVTSKTLSGVSPISQETDGHQTILKPSSEEPVGNDLGSVAVTTTVVEETEVSVVSMVQQEGHFGKCMDEDEGMKVNCSENGTTVVMDVEGCLEGKNGSYVNPEAKDGFVDGEYASADPMDIEKTGYNEAEIVEPNEDVNKTDDENVLNGEDSNGKELAANFEEEDHKFVVGDFVWGKIKSHQWWPGQIYDPSDASDQAASLKHDGQGQLLVAHFGDRSFSWCSPSQLKPFIDNFQEMSSQSNSKKFVNAVQKVLKEVGRRVEAQLMCKYRTANTIQNSVVNSGIKKGVCATKGNTVKVLINRLEPVELLSTLKGYAMMEPGTGLVDLELTVLKSCLTVFYAKKLGSGSEEETKRVVGDSDIITGPSSEDGDDKLYQKRKKKKSVAELMGEDESKIKKAKKSKDKRKALVVSVATESDHESGGGGGGGFEEETMSPRQRKKSRYLSPPYLSPVEFGRFSVLGSGTGSGSFKEPKTEPEKVSEMAAKQLEDSSKKTSGKKAKEHKKKADSSGSVVNVLDGLLRAALDPSSFVQKEKNLSEIMELVSSFRGSIFKEGSCKQTDQKEEGEEDTSKLGFIKQKLEWMSEMVQMCEESEMSADVKASLEGGLQEVLGKVVKMSGK